MLPSHATSLRLSCPARQAFDARQLAVKEVARLLQRPEDLARLPALRADYEGKQLANRSQLSYSIQSHVRAGADGAGGRGGGGMQPLLSL